ncbi:hypothetical protein HK100_000518 [Physocladia obscura]|uniref:Dolichyl-diphosphooligosaccharide--protein glycosyltransferase subunit WBP1 n=1 Tax=Physocladia obscura TaxID=109957 RepID=A0AAD5SY71_9FUNG|nr:hypothetical protein HK100_000518 [Physocladia obscura]
MGHGILRIVAAVVICFVTRTFAKPADPALNKILVVLNSLDQQTEFSHFLDSLEKRGFDLTIKAASDNSASLVAWEELAFNNLLLLADATSGALFTPAKVIDFVNRGGNVLIAASSQVSETIRDISIELSADFDEKGNSVFDSFNSPVKGKSDIISATKFAGEHIIIPPTLQGQISRGELPLLFRGVGHRLTGKNPLIMPVLVGNPTSFSYLDSTKGNAAPLTSGSLVGSSLVLISAFQARNNARVVFSGSVDLFKNEFVEAIIGDKTTANGRFANELTKWAFQEKDVLKVVKTFHHRLLENQQHGSYRIKEELLYEIELSAYYDDAWHPYASSSPIQFTATMLDPYIRQNMTLSSKVTDTTSIYTLPFLTPDVYGVFTFQVEHKRREGYSWIDEKEVVSIHPFRHDEYPRFLSAAFPYYANVFSIMAGFVVLSGVVNNSGNSGNGGGRNYSGDNSNQARLQSRTEYGGSRNVGRADNNYRENNTNYRDNSNSYNGAGGSKWAQAANAVETGRINRYDGWENVNSEEENYRIPHILANQHQR